MEVKKNVLRFCFIFLGLIFCLLFFGLKLISIQVFYSHHLAQLAQQQQNHLIDIEPVRGTIYDRRLRPLAFNVPIDSLFANPRMMSPKDKYMALEYLPALLDIDRATLAKQLGKDRYFVWIRRKLSMDVVSKIKELKIHGLGFFKESQRYYPNGSLAAHLIGFTGIDNNGLEGLELFYDKDLHGRPGEAQILRDARQQELLLERNYVAPVEGFHLVLTIDETIQYIAERALDKAYSKYSAKAAMIIVMDPKTGEILALANRPTYNLENPSATPLENRTNRAISYVYEPGSVFKVVTAAAALEEKAINEDDKIFCENGKYKIANHILTDHHPYGTLSFKEVIEFSSNIGVAKVAQKLGPQPIYNYGKKFRFGMKTGIDLRGEVEGWLKNPSQWSKTTIGAIPIGYEVTVTPLQLLGAISTIANDGIYMRPFVVKCVKDQKGETIHSFQPHPFDRVITSETARRLKEILKGVVENGTGEKAQIKGITVAGKTGTARKIVDGRYSDGKYYGTFMGFAPMDNPRLAAVVVIDEPHSSYFGGTVAAPVFKEVVENSLRYLENTQNETVDVTQRTPSRDLSLSY